MSMLPEVNGFENISYDSMSSAGAWMPSSTPLSARPMFLFYSSISSPIMRIFSDSFYTLSLLVCTSSGVNFFIFLASIVFNFCSPWLHSRRTFRISCRITKVQKEYKNWYRHYMDYELLTWNLLIPRTFFFKKFPSPLHQFSQLAWLLA